MAIREKDAVSFIRNFLVDNSRNFDFFLGAGASIQAGIPTGQDLIWVFKREIYCSETGTSREYFKDLQSNASRTMLQEHFDTCWDYPYRNDPSEYSFYFEKCYTSEDARKRFIQNQVQNIAPSNGHLCVAHLFLKNKINNIWTTNFDELIESGIKTLSPEYSFNVVSSIQEDSIKNIENNAYPCVFKLHGDYRYDDIKNTSKELQALEVSMSNLLASKLKNKGLVVVGYAGNDNSIMDVLDANINSSDFLTNGLYWIKPTDSQLSEKVTSLMERACSINENSCVINIDSFDEFLHAIYKNYGIQNEIIDKKWQNFQERKKPVQFSQNKANGEFIKTNTFISYEIPSCNSFETDISSWLQLREVIGENIIIAGLYNGKIYCFEEENIINKIFKAHIKSKIEKQIPPKQDLRGPNSVFIGLLYKLIEKSSLMNNGMSKFDENKYYFPSSKVIHKNYIKYDAVEFSLSYYNENYYLSVLPTVYLTLKDGTEPDRNAKQLEINSVMSSVYNPNYNDKIKTLNEFLYKKDGSKAINFEYGNFILKFNFIYISSGGQPQAGLSKLNSFSFQEPEMTFSAKDNNSKAIHQLKGLIKYGPIDNSFLPNNNQRPPIRLAVLSPAQKIDNILGHLNALNCKHSPSTKDLFLTNFEGFSDIYRKAIIVPDKNNSALCKTYDEAKTISATTAEFLETIKREINYFSTQISDFDVLVIYIPQSFSKFREDKSYNADFNLHDDVKLYATDKSVKVQFVEEKSLNASDKCKVMWALSTSLYAKASGVLWHPLVLEKNTAFVGISYAKSNTRGICIGCSQLFDSAGTGMRLILKKIEDPQYIGKNPYMKQDEARNTLSKLREEYYKCDPTSKLTRIVIHKTTPFTSEEIIGFTKALEGIDDIELLQIQGISSWRGIRFQQEQEKLKPHMFSLPRGTVMKIFDDSFLLWSHGCVKNNEIDSRGYNYYKGGRGIPMPLLIKRFYGKASGDRIVQEILMLTKMNWNSGDNLYKNMPVTLDFAKTLSRMSKQNEALYNKSYDFRYFM